MAEREMTGIEALEELINMIPKEKHINSIHNNKIDILKYNVLKFLDKLEQLEKENQELIVNKNVAQNIAKKQKVEIEKLEKELKQTKLNFKNSQTHSKNCYKKLKEKYEKLERAYKNNEVMTRDLNELINRNLELRKQIENLEEENQGVKDDNTRLWHGLECANNENAKLKQAVITWNENGGKLLMENIKLNQALEKACERLDGDCPVSQELIDDLDCEECESNCKECWVKFFLKQVFESVGDSDE